MSSKNSQAPEAQVQAVIPYDVNLLERSRTQWQHGDWESLLKLDRSVLQHHPESAELSLLAASARLQIGLKDEAIQYIQWAKDLGVNNVSILRILSAGVHSSLGRAALLASQVPRALNHYECCIDTGTPGVDVKSFAQNRLNTQLEQLNRLGQKIAKQNKPNHGLTMKQEIAVELEYCVTRKIEQNVVVAANKLLGERLFAGKKLELAPFKAVSFSGWGDWEHNPLNNRSWQWRLNWLSFLSYLMAHHRAVGDDAVLDMGKAAIESWLDTYLDTDASYPFEFIWHDHATALRAEQLVLFAYYCRAHAPAWTAAQWAFFEYLEQALQVHGAWLANDSFYSEHTNHGLEQARVLLLLGTVFEGEVAHDWQAVAVRRISSELNFSFTSEGVHVENSPAYHIFVFKVFMGIIRDYPAEVLGDLDEQFSQFSAKALDFIAHILRPDGLLPPIGDTEQLPTSDSYRETFGHTLGYQHFVYALTKGQKGLRPKAVNRVYPESGYAVFRDQWPAHPQYDKALHLIVKVGCSSRYHHQQDEGHVSLYAGGEDWLIDSGLYNHINTDPVRKYMRGRTAHNVPLISHASYDKEFEHRLRAWQVTAYDEASPRPFVEMKLEVMPPIVHTRRVDFDAEARVVAVQDAVSAEDGQLRNITLQWHFPKDKTIVIEGNTVVVSSATGNRLTVDFEVDAPDQLTVVAGRKDDRVFSCISYKANQVEPSQLLQVVFAAHTGLQVTTRFTFDLAEEQRGSHSYPL